MSGTAESPRSVVTPATAESPRSVVMPAGTMSDTPKSPACIQIAEQMLGGEISPVLERMLIKANSRIANSGGDGGPYGRELRSTQAVAAIIAAWETLPPTRMWR